jgi:hypothetical protein
MIHNSTCLPPHPADTLSASAAARLCVHSSRNFSNLKVLPAAFANAGLIFFRNGSCELQPNGRK